jgi:SnoaL-like domain
MPTAIEEKDAIREVLAEYCFALDGGRYDDMAALFTGDGTSASRVSTTVHRRR